MLIEHTAKASTTNAKTLTGDWRGLRSELADEGVLLTAIYTSEAAENPLGGDEQRTAYADEWAFGATLDLQKLLSLRAAEFHLTITERYGQALDQMADLHTLMQVQEIYGRGQTWRLTECWYQEKWLDNHLVWKFGRLPVGENFCSFDCHFQNLTFCGSQAGSVRGDYWYNYPVSQWATRLDFAVTEQVKLKLGVYQVNPTYVNDSWCKPRAPSGSTEMTNIALTIDYILELTPGVTGRIVELKSAWVAIGRQTARFSVADPQLVGKRFAADLGTERNVSH